MPDSVEAEVTPQEGQVAPQETAAPTPDPYEAKAREAGWRPQTEWEGDADEWVDAKEFVRRAPLYDRLKTQGKKLKEMDKALHDLSNHSRKIEEIAYSRAIADLQKEKRQAVEEADPVRVAEIDQELDKIRKEKPAEQPQNQIHPAVSEWLGKRENQWFHDNPEMRSFAEAAHNAVFARNPNMDMDESLAEVNKMVRRAFPDKFTNPARAAAAPVETSSSAPAGKKSFALRDLNDEQRKIAERFDRMGIMKKDDYIKQLADNGLIGG